MVHRLDRDTSGVMILARTTAAREFLVAQFAKRLVKKEYEVLVAGHMPHQQARVELPLARSSQLYQKMVVHAHGKPAVLEYKVKKRLKDFDLLDVQLLTGRTHQIRAQMAYLGHAVAGDELYGKTAKKIPQPPRQFVHSKQLTIELPSGSWQTFDAPLAHDLADFLKGLS